MAERIQDITPLEAFRRILRAQYPAAADWAGEVTSYEWFWHDWQRSPDRTFEDVVAATTARDALIQGVRSARVKLYTRKLSLEPWSIQIPDSDLRAGELHIFEGTFRFYSIMCVVCDQKNLEQVLGIDRDAAALPTAADEPPAPTPPSSEGGRPSDKERIVNETQERLKTKSYPSKMALARELEKWLDKLPDAVRNSEGKVTSPDTIARIIADAGLWKN
jgi:hypothetical protein